MLTKKTQIFHEDLSLDYRTRIYEHYVNSRNVSLAPANVASLKPRMHAFNKIIKEHFPPQKTIQVLDLGCGHGAFVYACQQAGYKNIVGVDASSEQVDEARRLGIEGVKLGDILQTLKSISDGSPDVVIAFDVIEHFHKNELLPFVDEVRRILRSGGKWIIHIPNGESLFGGRIRYGDFTHEISFTNTSITQLLKSSRFSKIMCQEDEPIPHGMKSAVRWVIWKAIRCILQFYLAVETGSAGNSIFSQNFLCVAVKSAH